MLRNVTAVMAALLIAVAPRAHAQSSRPEFEVASIKQEPPGPNIGTGFVRPLGGGRLTAEKALLRVLIWNAYRVRDYQVVGGPEWINSTRYNIEAKATDNASSAELMLMLQSLLADRFNLKVHRETRNLPVYELRIATIISRLQRSKPGSCHACGVINGFISATSARINGEAVLVSELARVLGNMMGRPVFDKTALTGTFDIHLEFARDQVLQGFPAIDVAPPTLDPAGVTVFTAIQEQLGLKLESVRGPVEVLVIDSVQKPSEN